MIWEWEGQEIQVRDYLPGQTDRRGNHVETWSELRTIEGSFIDPGGSDLDTTGVAENRVTTEPTLYTPPGERIRAKSKITTPIGEFTADGDTRVWVSPWDGTETGGTTPLRKVT